jgi:hypothetical protein
MTTPGAHHAPHQGRIMGASSAHHVMRERRKLLILKDRGGAS